MMAKGSKQQSRIVALFPELGSVGGIQESGRLTALALKNISSKNGWSTEFLALNDPRGPHRFSLNETEVPFRGFGRSKWKLIYSSLRLARGGTEVALALHPNLAAVTAQMKLLHPRCKMVTVSHGIEVWAPVPWLRRLAFGRSDLFLAPSRYTAEKITEVQGVPESKVRRLPWPLSPEILRMAQDSDNLRWPAAFPDGLVVLTVARLAAAEKYKGVDRLIQSIARLRSSVSNLHLVVIGGGDDLPRHIQLAHELRVADCVHFFDNLSRAEIAACYSHSDVFAMPSTGEGFGLVFLEAMAFRKPLIGAAAGGIPDVVEDCTNGFLVPASDLDQLCRVMELLLVNGELRNNLGQKGGEIVRTKYSFGEFSAQLESILRGCGLE
jgi:phosphatidyl-myo-inositol dimannoside synthase